MFIIQRYCESLADSLRDTIEYEKKLFLSYEEALEVRKAAGHLV